MNLKNILKSTLIRFPIIGKRIIELDTLRSERDALLSENKKIQLVGKPSELDRSMYVYPCENKPKIANHGQIYPYLSSFANKKNVKVLEIGSRSVCSDSTWKKYIPESDYIGFDFHQGKNVNFVGDAHKLSDYFEKESFDIIVSLAVFEHLAMPWIVAEEISKILKIGGLVCIETHFSFSEHELPWHFFQFNSKGLECLFNTGLGYQIVDSGMDNPIVGRFALDSCEYLRGRPVGALYCHSSLIAKKIKPYNPKENSDPWRDSLSDFLGSSIYPQNTGL